MIIAVLILFFSLFFYSLYLYQTNEQKAFMRYLLNEVKLSYEINDLDPETFVQTYDTEIDRRITILDGSGYVIADTHSDVVGTDKSGRPEIKDLGSISIRQSATVNIDLMYIATEVDDGNILRVSVAIEPILNLYQRVIIIFIIGGTLLMLGYYALLSRVNKQLLQPWQTVKQGLIALNHGKYQMMPLTHDYKEINEILHEMNIINIETSKNLNKITAYQLQLDKILNEMKQGVILFNAKDEIIYFNDDARNIFDLTDQSMFAESYQSIRHHEINQAINQSNKHQTISKLDIQHKGKILEMSVFPIHSNRFSLQDATVLSLIKDVTQERQLEQIKKDFISHASHELKSPLTAIRGYAELIMHDMIKKDEIKESTHQIIKQTEMMAQLVEDMLMLSRLESLKETPSTAHQLDEILHEVLINLKNSATQKNITIQSHIDSVQLVCDTLDMQKLFKNLIENAIKYSDENTNINVQLINQENHIEFKVKDEGIGISEENQQRIFERFYRVDKGRLIEGTGLGLAIVKHIVVKYQGEIELHSKLGAGTEIKVTFKK